MWFDKLAYIHGATSIEALPFIKLLTPWERALSPLSQSLELMITSIYMISLFFFATKKSPNTMTIICLTMNWSLTNPMS